jgi:cold shock CspA family protein
VSLVEQAALVSLGLDFKHKVTLPDRPAAVFSVATSDSILNELLREGFLVKGFVMGVSRAVCIACVVEGGDVAPDVVAQLVDGEEDIALTHLPTEQDADGRMLFLAPDADSALQLVRRPIFQANGGAGFTFTLAETARPPPPPQPPDGSSAVRIVLPDGTDAASRDTVLGNVVKVLANKGFSVKVSPSAPDVFILSAESAPRIEELLHPADPHRIRGVTVSFKADSLEGSDKSAAAKNEESAADVRPSTNNKPPRFEKQRSLSADRTSDDTKRRHASNNETVLGGDLKVGKCKNFLNGYGFIIFITNDGKKRDIFVHSSDIYARDGEKYPSLAVGEAVEFYIVKDPKYEVKAVKVTGPKRAHVQGKSTGEPSPRSSSFGTPTERSWDNLRR